MSQSKLVRIWLERLGRHRAKEASPIQSKSKEMGIYTLLSILDVVPALPALQVPHGVDLGHLTEAADHGQVNPDIQTQNPRSKQLQPGGVKSGPW